MNFDNLEAFVDRCIQLARQGFNSTENERNIAYGAVSYTASQLPYLAPEIIKWWRKKELEFGIVWRCK